MKHLSFLLSFLIGVIIAFLNTSIGILLIMLNIISDIHSFLYGSAIILLIFLCLVINTWMSKK